MVAHVLKDSKWIIKEIIGVMDVLMELVFLKHTVMNNEINEPKIF